MTAPFPDKISGIEQIIHPPDRLLSLAHPILQEQFRTENIPGTFTTVIGNQEYVSVAQQRQLSMEGHAQIVIPKNRENPNPRIVYTLPDTACEALMQNENQIVMLAIPNILAVRGDLLQHADELYAKKMTIKMPGENNPIYVPLVSLKAMPNLVKNGSDYLPDHRPVGKEDLRTTHREVILFRRQGNKIYWQRDQENIDHGEIQFIKGEPITFSEFTLYLDGSDEKNEPVCRLANKIAERDSAVRILIPGSTEKNTGNSQVLQTLQNRATSLG
jgi:hypothetical protein